jgi:hypothetical protein
MRANDGIVKVDQGRRLRSAEPAFIYFTHRSTRSGQTNLALSLSAPVRRVGVLVCWVQIKRLSCQVSLTPVHDE